MGQVSPGHREGANKPGIQRGTSEPGRRENEVPVDSGIQPSLGCNQADATESTSQGRAVAKLPPQVWEEHLPPGLTCTTPRPGCSLPSHPAQVPSWELPLLVLSW